MDKEESIFKSIGQNYQNIVITCRFFFLYVGGKIKEEERENVGEEWHLYAKITWGHTMIAKISVNLQYLHINFNIKKHL